MRECVSFGKCRDKKSVWPVVSDRRLTAEVAVFGNKKLYNGKTTELSEGNVFRSDDISGIIVIINL